MLEIPRLHVALRMGRAGLAAAVAGAACLGLPGVASGAGHLVVPGETLSGIAAANGLSTSALAAANGLSPTSFVISGTTLSIPAPGTGAASTGAPGTPATGGGHLVVPGETLSGIAAANGLSTSALAAANGLSPTSFVIAGTRLAVPAAAASQTGAGTGQVQAGVPNAPMPTPVRLSGAEIGQIAAENGIAPSLAKAVAWQESGFNNAVLSSANARGIMQIIPPTWQFIQSNLSSSQLDPESPVDNVRAGSLLLRHLLANAGGDPTTALAGYYQGPNSVRRIGLLPETQTYVSNVLALRDRFGR